MQIPPLVAPVLERCVAGLCALCGENLLFIVLFGSIARGQLKPETDVDLFVGVEHGPRGMDGRHQLASRLEEMVERELAALGQHAHRIRVSPLFRGRTQLERFAPLYLGVATDGILLWQCAGEGDAFIAAVRERNTRRERIGRNWYWVNV